MATGVVGGGRVVWLAVADARGHLMRAHLVRGLLAREGIEVDVLTTSAEGVGFLSALGTPARLLSRHHGVCFDERQNVARGPTERRVLRYLASPGRFWRDLATVEALARGADLVVNDLHPVLLLRPLLRGWRRGRGLRVVHLYGENLWGAIERHFDGRAPDLVARGFAAALRALRGRAFARIEHALDVPAERAPVMAGARTYRLPPIVAGPARPRAAVRAALGVGAGERLAAVYLNPHFRDPAIAAAVEAALAGAGFRVHAVGEGYARRPGWNARDAGFADAAAAADLLVSAPGMGALGQARAFGLPFLAVLTDQPEQARNLALFARGGGPPLRVVPVNGDAGRLGAHLLAAARSLAAEPRPPPPPADLVVARIHAAWAQALGALVRSASAAEPQGRRPTHVRPAA